jgi:transposase
MESTSSYWKGVYYLLEAEGFQCWLVNAREVKNVPGRAKTDRADAVWLAQVAERGMCRPSLVQPPEIRRLRDLTRYRRALVQDRTREQQRVEKLLEDAQITISAVLTNLHGMSGRAMMEALIAGQRDPRALAQLAKGHARKKTDRLEEALRGFFTDHHAVILQMMLDNCDRISAQIATLDARIEEAISPFSPQAARLVDIPGVDTVTAAELIAEIGVDMTRFPSAAHLVSWAKFCPQTHQSAGKSKAKGRGKGNPWLAGTLGRIVFANCRSETFLGARYRRLARRRGKQKAIVAIGNSALTVVYHLLSDPDATSAPDTTNPGSTNTAVPVIWPPNSKRSPANKSSSATAQPSLPTPPPSPQTLNTATRPGFAGCLRPAHSPSDFRVRMRHGL